MQILNKLKKIKLNKGSSEFISFAYVAPFICFLIIEACAYVNLNSNVHELLLALDSAGRGACICTNFDDAEDMAQMIAESSIHSTDISNIQINIDYATADTDWKAGLLLKITITADINSLSILFNPSFSTTQGYRTVSKTMIYTVEGATYNNDDVTILAAAIYMEAGSTDEGMIACGTSIMNRVDSPSYPDNVHDVIMAYDQYEVTFRYPYCVTFNKYINGTLDIPSNALNCATRVLSGERDERLMSCPYSSAPNNGPCRSFFTDNASTENNYPKGINIKGNWYHWYW